MYVADILIASSSIKLLKDAKEFLSTNFDIKDLSETSYILGIEFQRDISQVLLGLSQNNIFNGFEKI